jgi:hypothetical protein
MTRRTDELANQARHDLASGLSIIPIDHTTKRPAWGLLPIKYDDAGNVALNQHGQPKHGWEPYQERRATPDELERWLDAGVQAFAVVGGKISGNLEIIDFDVARLFHRWFDEVEPLIEQYGLPHQQTGSLTGYQVAYRASNRKGNQKLAWVPNDSEETGREIAIETRGEGGYAIFAPSLHPSGHHYTMIEGDFAEIPTIPEAVADVLLQAARRLCEMPYTKQELAKLAGRKNQERNQQSGGDDDVIAAYNSEYKIRSVLASNNYIDAGDRMSRPGKEYSAGVVVLVMLLLSFVCSSF